jgi:hypothetical protein
MDTDPIEGSLQQAVSSSGDAGAPVGCVAAPAAAAAAAAAATAAAATAGPTATAPSPSSSTGTMMPPPPNRAPWATAAAPPGPPSSNGPPSSPRSSSAGGSARSASPATGSHFPQLARPLPGGAAVTGSTHDTMSPTAAPWAIGGSGGAPPPTTRAIPGLAFPGAGAAGLSAGVAALRRPLGSASASAAGALLTGKPVAPLVDAQPQMPKALERPPAAFEAPSKRIGSEEDLKRFLGGEAAKDFVAFILSLNQAVTGGRAAGGWSCFELYLLVFADNCPAAGGQHSPQFS